MAIITLTEVLLQKLSATDESILSDRIWNKGLSPQVRGKLPEIILNPDTDVLHNPKRNNSAFLVYREPQ
jgi:hypothetical protein